MKERNVNARHSKEARKKWVKKKNKNERKGRKK